MIYIVFPTLLLSILISNVAGKAVLHKASAGCTALKNLGMSFTDVSQCADSALADSECTGYQIMWTDSSNDCTCCSAGRVNYFLTANSDIYRIPTIPGKGCINRNLGTSYSDPFQCGIAGAKHADCNGQIMWSDSYNHNWGCRCCTGALGEDNNVNWDIYDGDNDASQSVGPGGFVPINHDNHDNHDNHNTLFWDKSMMIMVAMLTSIFVTIFIFFIFICIYRVGYKNGKNAHILNKNIYAHVDEM